MNYQPFFDMNVLVSDAFLSTLPILLTIIIICFFAFITLMSLRKWLHSDNYIK